MLSDATELSSQLFDDSSANAALQREVEGVGVSNDRVVLSLPSLVIGSPAVKLVAVIVVDGVTIHCREF